MLKRAFDLAVSLLLLVLSAPFLLIIAVAIKLDSPGPVFYRATRIGQGGEPFKLYKFRSMVSDADKQGPGITTAGDSRITRVGAVLRRTKLDELPQVLNILRGEMSLVGPRPEDPRYVALYTPEQRRVLDVRPGLTSPASVAYRHEEQILTGPDWEERYIHEVMPAKLAIDARYAANPSLGHDVQILLQTLIAVFRKAPDAADSP
ncbi:MAG: sugar transferase [Anaerolineae bacterium]